MTRNVYDDDAFFEAYAQLARSQRGLDGAPEWPRVRALLQKSGLPGVPAPRVLDLGCGFGAFARWAADSGAHSVLGIDLASRMLERARELTRDTHVQYLQGDMSTVPLVHGAFELAYSALALHYVADIGSLFPRIFDALVPGGHFVFTIEHPLFTAPANPEWHHDTSGMPYWPLNNYLDEGERTTNWLAPGVVKQHRSIATYLNTLIQSGFKLQEIVEWAPSAEDVAAHPDWRNERERPPFLLVAAQR